MAFAWLQQEDYSSHPPRAKAFLTDALLYVEFAHFNQSEFLTESVFIINRIIQYLCSFFFPDAELMLTIGELLYLNAEGDVSSIKVC